MPLAQRADARGHSVLGFWRAAKARFREAQALAIAGHRLGSNYLLGYVVEMLLKSAYFRLLGWSSNDPIAASGFRVARSQAHTLGVGLRGNLHDLTGWRDLLIAERQARRCPYPPSLRRALNAKVRVLSLNWCVVLRYHDMRPFEGELLSSLRATTWMIARYKQL